MELQVRVVREKEIPYRGPELRPHYILESQRVEGSAVLGFVGLCDVKTDHLVDWEDRLANDSIRAAQMAHVLGEFFGITLREGVWAQRLLMATALEVLRRRAPQAAAELRRDGDDLFWGDAKLSVSIVTASAVSVLLHAAINIDASGAPVKASGLKDLGVSDPYAFLEEWLGAFASEWKSIFRATTKVRPV